MKRILILTAAVMSALPIALSAQASEDSSRRKTDDEFWERKNVVSVGVSGFSGNGFGMGFAPITISYDRRLSSGITIGGMLHGARNFFRISTDSYEVDDASVFAGARVGYDLRIARRLCLRFGLGAGAGFHRITDMSNGEIYHPLPPYPHTLAKPYLSADIHWVWRVARNMELAFAPLIITPSQFIFSPGDEYYSGGYYGNNIVPVRLGVRF